MEKSMTNEQLVKVAAVFAETIRDITRANGIGVPSGELYAMVMGKITPEEYNLIIAELTRTKLVNSEGFLLTWIGK